MKTITNLLLVLTLTASMAFADGHTNGGGRCDTCPPPCETCLTAPESEPPTTFEEQADEETDDESLYEYWKEVLTELFY